MTRRTPAPAHQSRPVAIPPPDPAASDLDSIRCLSIRAPWCSLILAGIKPVECRSWATDYRGPLVIHSASSRASLNRESWDWLDWMNGTTHEWLRENWPGDRAADWRGEPLGAILGVVDVHECLPATVPIRSQAAWWPADGFVWRLVNPRKLATPIPCSGKLSLWKPPGEALAEIAKIL